MSTPKSISQFPRQWIDLINAVAIKGHPVTMREIGGKPLTKSLASKLRFRFYSIRTLLRKDVLQQDTATLSECIEVTLTETTPGFFAVNFASRDTNSEARALEDALKDLNF